MARSYRDMDPGESGGPPYDPTYFDAEFSLTECSPGDTVDFEVSIADDSGNTWSDAFSVDIVSSDADLVYHDHTLSDSRSHSSRNNGNGRIEAGETIRFVIELRNVGGSTARGVEASLSTASSCATVETTVARSYRDMDPGESGGPPYAPNYIDVEFSVTECSTTETVEFEIEIEDVSENIWSDLLVIELE